MENNRKLFENIRDWKRQFGQIGILLLLFILVLVSIILPVDIKTCILKLFTENGLRYNDIDLKLRILIAIGFPAIFLVVLGIVFYLIHKSNKEKVLNSGKFYHKHLYFSYWICNKILGYKRCNLKGVPIYLQFKMILNDLFTDFIYEEGIHKCDTKENIQVFNQIDDCSAVNSNGKTSQYATRVINLLLIDTYNILNTQIPDSVKDYPFISISRFKENDKTRYQSEEYIKTITTIVRGLPSCIKEINVFGTLNPYHVYHIVKEVFNTGGRDSIRHLYVYDQRPDGIRKFKDKKYKVF
jgi:hypothetical protein